MVLKRRKKRGRNLSRIEEKKRKENEHHELTLNVLSGWSNRLKVVFLRKSTISKGNSKKHQISPFISNL